MVRTSTSVVHSEIYRGFAIEITCTEREGSVMMPIEFMAFIGCDMTFDDCDTQEQALTLARGRIDVCCAAV